MYKRQVSAMEGGGGKIIGLLLFWGRILGPATVFFGFSDYFLTSAGSVSFRELKMQKRNIFSLI